MTGLLKLNSAVLRPKRKATFTGFLLAFIIGVLEANLISNPPSTWYDGYIKCRHNNQTMLSWGMWNIQTTDLNIKYPVWLYGLEVRIHNKIIKNRFYMLDQLQSNMAASIRCVRGKLLDDDFKKFSFEQAHEICQNHTSGSNMLSVTDTNLDQFRISSDIINMSFWINGVEVGTFLNSEDLIVHCFVLNQHGELRKDNCTKSYSSVCVNATVHDTIQYSGHDSKVPNYDPTSPTIHVTSSADKPVMEEKILIALICVGVAVVTALFGRRHLLLHNQTDTIRIIGCLPYRKPNKDRRQNLSDSYSETADSVHFKDAQHNEVSDISEYATPSDAVTGDPRTARPRSSIIEGEYDVISNSKATDKSKRQVAVVKAYSHVAIVPANQRRESNSNMENAYDVSTLNKQTTVTISQQDGTRNVYGHLGVT